MAFSDFLPQPDRQTISAAKTAASRTNEFAMRATLTLSFVR